MAVNPKDLPKDYVISGVEVLEMTLGEGAYGVVKLGKYYGLLCAVKKLKPSMFPVGMKQLDQQSELILQSFYNECEKLSKIRHPNVVQLLGMYVDKHTHLPIIVMELMHESLSRLLFRTKSLPLYAEINICHDVAQALAYLHAFRPPIVHRDLSSNNIMLNTDMHAKVTDLGVAKVAKGSFLNWDNTPAPGTLQYMPPEVRKVPADLSPAMDLFALGVNAIQIRTHKFPKPGPEFVSGILGFSKMVPERDRRREHLDLMGRSHPLRSLALECVRDNPRDRPSALKICNKMERVKESREYQESLQLAQLKDNEVERIKQEVSDLEQNVSQIREELTDKVMELERVKGELERERNYTAELLEQRAREQVDIGQLELMKTAPPGQKLHGARPFILHHLQKGNTMDDLSATAPSSLLFTGTSSKDKKRKKLFKIKKPKWSKKGRSSDIADAIIINPSELGETTGEEEPQSKHPSGQVYDESGNSGEEESTLLAGGGDIQINGETEETEAEITRRRYKVKKLAWYTHRCLPRGLQGSTLRVHECGGRLYACGGANQDGSPNKGIYYCPVQNLTRWVKATPDAPQYYCASAIVQGELVLISGLSSSDGKCTGTLLSYDHKAQVWVSRYPPIPTPRSSAAAFVYGDYLIVVGGQNSDGDATSVVEVLHISTQVWETATHLPEKLVGQSVAVCGDTAYLLGGSNGSSCVRSLYTASVRKIISSCHRFALLASVDRAGKVWKQHGDCPFTMMVAACTGNQLLAFGGEEVTKAATHPSEWIWIYDPDEDTWTPIQSMPSARKLCCITFLPDNNLVILGGYPDFNRIDIAEII